MRYTHPFRLQPILKLHIAVQLRREQLKQDLYLVVAILLIISFTSIIVVVKVRAGCTFFVPIEHTFFERRTLKTMENSEEI